MTTIQELELDKYNRRNNLTLIFGGLSQKAKTAAVASAPPEPTEKTIKEEEGIFKLTEKELMKMPAKIRQYFRAAGCTVHYRIRTDWRYNKSYEARYAKKPFNKHPISVSAKTFAELRANFIEKLKNYQLPDDTPHAIPKTFDGFALYWFENFHKRKVIKETYKNNLALYNRHIKPKFENLLLTDIIPAEVQKFLEGLPGNGKTADDIYSILNQIFNTAISHKIMELNPLDLFVHKQHERENGVELTPEEVLKLLSETEGTAYHVIFAVYIFCGLRPNEYSTAKVQGAFIVARNSKQKNGKVEYKKIPICNALAEIIAPYNGLELPKRHPRNIQIEYKKHLPNHTLKDLRKTFSTYCVNLHVDFYAKEKFLGHSVGKLDKPYVGTIDDYLLAEGKKLNEWEIYPKITPKN